MRVKKRRMPGMLYIIVSFIPWIVYWTLCGFGNVLGIVLSLIISLLLIIPQILKRDFNLIDLISTIYFSTAFLGTFVFNSNIFIQSSGFLGYFVLFLMALSSLIIKRPYTLQVSKRDYPEVYWKDRTFLSINNIITSVWAATFLANATIFLLLKAPLTIIFSNFLMGIGISFSIVFPIKAPAYFASKEFKKFDWKLAQESEA
jgi:all-trans-retinol 13,14-reductase